ncbi:MAG: transporter substrate-binding domain-containing protein [Magnetospirillum sp. WYHS-4]
MTGGRVIRVLVVVLCLGFPAGPAVAGPECEIVVGSCHRAPLSTTEGAGILDRLVVEAFRRIGRKACIVPLPCERSLVSADEGTTDGDILRIPAAVAGRYPNLEPVAEPLYDFSFQCFAIRPEVAVKGWDDLASLRVGHILGWKILEDRVRAAEVLRVRGPDVLFSLLAEGKVDTVVYERLTGIGQMRDMTLAGGRVIEPPLLVIPQHIVLNRRHGALSAPLAEAIRTIKADGTYAAAFRVAGFEPPGAGP